MALLNRNILFGGLRAIAKKLRRRHSSSNKALRFPSSSTPPSYGDHSTSSSSSSSSSASPSSYRNDLRRVFAEYDADGDGRISLHDLARVVTAVGGGRLSASDAAAEAAEMMEVADLDRDAYIDFEEFQTLMTTTTTTTTTTATTTPKLSPSPPAGSPHDTLPPDADAGVAYSCTPFDPEQGCPWPAADELEDIRLAFAVYDHDGDGVITAQEIHAVLRRLMDNTTITLADCRRMVQAVDSDGDGVVGFQDFAAMMMTTAT